MYLIEIFFHLVLQARKLKYKLEDVRRRGRRDNGDNGELGRTGEQTGRTEVEKQAGRTEQVAVGRSEQSGRTDPGEKKREEEEHENGEGEGDVEERSEVTQVFFFSYFAVKFLIQLLFFFNISFLK